MTRWARASRQTYFLLFLYLSCFATSAFANTLVVNSFADLLVSGDGLCTLREAVMNANSNTDNTAGDCAVGGGADLITIPAGTFSFAAPTALESIIPGNEDASKNDLDIVDDVIIRGSGKGITVLDGGLLSGIFHFPVGGVVATIEDLTISNAGEVSANSPYEETAILINSSGAQTILTLSRIEVLEGYSSQARGAIHIGDTASPNTSDVNVKLRIIDAEVVNSPYYPIHAGGWRGSLSLESSTVRGNGKPMFVSNFSPSNSSKTVSIANSTFSGSSGDVKSLYYRNTSALYVQGQQSNSSMLVEILNSTFSDNETNLSNGRSIALFGASDGTGATFEMTNTIVGRTNTRYGASADCYVNDPNVFADLGHNLVEDGSCITASSSLSGDPLLTVLGSFGGETQTHGLLAGSPALDGGNNVICHDPSGPINGLDQRNTARPINNICDIGAFEGVQTNPLIASTTIAVNDLSDNIVQSDGLCTLREALINANTNDDQSGGDCLAGTADDLILLPSGIISLSAPVSIEAPTATIAVGYGYSDTSKNDLDILDDVTIRGSGKGLTVIDGGGLSGVFHLPVGGVSILIEDLTISNSGESSLNQGETALLLNARGRPVLLTLSRIEISNSTDNGYSDGAIEVGNFTEVSLSIVDSELANNADSPLYATYWYGSITVDSSTLRGNGNAVFISNSYATTPITNRTVIIANSTFEVSENNGSFVGALSVSGTYQNQPMAVGIYNSTINVDPNNTTPRYSVFLNSATNGTGAIFEMANTIIANSSGIYGSRTDCYLNTVSYFSDLGNNLVEDNSCITAANSLSGDPGLDVLSDNGGGTLTYAPLTSTSAAVGVGDIGICAVTPVLNVDQRGVSRLDDGHCDIGAVEYVSTNIAPIAMNDISTALGSTPLEIDVLVNDTDTDGTLNLGSVNVVTSPSNGELSVNASSGTITYTHDGSNFISDLFTYTVLDDEGAESNLATVSLTIQLLDTTNPIASISVPSVNQWLAPGTQLSGAAIEELGGSGIASVQVALYDLTNGQWVDANGNPNAMGSWITQYAVVSGNGESESWTYDLGNSIVSGNTYRFYVVAIDQQGNSESFNYLDAVVFTVSTTQPDTTNPIASISVPSVNQWLAPGTQLSGAAIEELGGSGIASVQVALYDLTNGQWVDANGNPNAMGSWITQYAVVSGNGESESWTYDLGNSIVSGNTYRFYAVAIDQQGNSESFSYLDAVVFTVSTTLPDTTEPVATINVPVAHQVVAVSTQFSGNAVDEVGGSGIGEVQVALYDLSNNQWVDFNGNPSTSGGWITQYAVVSGNSENESWTYDLGSSFPTGNSYRFYSVAIDNAGNSKPFSYLDALVFTAQ